MVVKSKIGYVGSATARAGTSPTPGGSRRALRIDDGSARSCCTCSAREVAIAGRVASWWASPGAPLSKSVSIVAVSPLVLVGPSSGVGHLRRYRTHQIASDMFATTLLSALYSRFSCTLAH